MMQFFFLHLRNMTFHCFHLCFTTNFCNAEVIGTTTSGEISNSGFTKNSIVLTALSCSRTRFSGIALDGVDKFPIVHKQELEDAARKIGIKCADPMSHKDAFAITFVNGLCNAEEALLSFFYSVIKTTILWLQAVLQAMILNFRKLLQVTTALSFRTEP